MKTPLISIVIPAYNAEHYINEAINSILAQTITEYEIIVVDDGSTDLTREKVETFGNAVQLIIQKNKGPAAARNLGILKAKGKYIAFLDADDWWFENKLEIELEAIERNSPIAFICTDYFCGQFGNENQKSTLRDYEVWNYERSSFDMMLRENFVNTSTILILKEEITKAGLFNERFRGSEDRHMWLRLLCDKDALVIKKILAFRRYHSQNTSSTLAYGESQLAMVEDLLSWPIIVNNHVRVQYLRSRKKELQHGLGIRASAEKRFAPASQIYWNLFKQGYKPLHCSIRFALFYVLSKIHPKNA